MATHSSILAWKIPRTEEPGGLWSMGSQRVRHDLETKQDAEGKLLGGELIGPLAILEWVAIPFSRGSS